MWVFAYTEHLFRKVGTEKNRDPKFGPTKNLPTGRAISATFPGGGWSATSQNPYRQFFNFSPGILAPETGLAQVFHDQTISKTNLFDCPRLTHKHTAD
jgi:hypothetical protein